VLARNPTVCAIGDVHLQGCQFRNNLRREEAHQGHLVVDRHQRGVLDPSPDHPHEEVKAVKGKCGRDPSGEIQRGVVAKGNHKGHHSHNTGYGQLGTGSTESRETLTG
jgi:hypothetical protein